jgi:acetyltransferase-like isoleucine patch superfamily enzyme
MINKVQKITINFILGMLKFFMKSRQFILRIFYTTYAKHKAVECGKKLRVNYKSIFSGKVYFGDNCNFNGMVVSGGGTVFFGSNFHSGNSCLIISQNHNYNSGQLIPYDHTYKLNEIVIKDNVWLGNNVIIIGNVTIGEGVVVAVGSVVVKDIPDFAIVGGNPAKIIKYRDVEHYLKLKSESRFC